MDHDTIVNKKKPQLKHQIKSILNKKWIDKILTQGNNKSKIRDLLIHKTKESLGKIPKYMTHLRRDECTSIFAIRSRMIKTKTNKAIRDGRPRPPRHQVGWDIVTRECACQIS